MRISIFTPLLTPSVVAMALFAVSLGEPAWAQSGFVQGAAVPEADELAGQMRSLAANPLDLNALIRAGELTLDLGDTTAAAGFFARAERIDPRNARIKAGLGGLLVLAERPGEALRRFAEAESLGRDARYYAAQRGLAYDLVGQQERAQRDYRLALRTMPDDETVRRYALSLGISGQRDQALEQIDSLLRKSDRGAWRSRAFILAMTGDTAGASRIATSMMPAGMAQGLDPFFERLPQLSAADRAFAVHFGEVRATPQRLADARLTPPFAALPPEPGRPVVLAAATIAAPLDAKAARRAAKQRKREAGRVSLAAAPQPRPVPLPQPPGYVATASAAPVVVLRPPITLADRGPAPIVTPPVDRIVRRVEVPREADTLIPVDPENDTRDADQPPSAVVALHPRPAEEAVAVIAQPAVVAPPPRHPAEETAAVVVQPPVVVPSPLRPAGVAAAVVAQPTVAAPPPAESAPLRSEPTQLAAIATAVPAPAARVVLTPAAPQRPPISEDSILARIVANITIPGSELESAPPKRAVGNSSPPAIVRAAAIDPAKAIADRKIAAAKAVAEKKALADKKALAEKKAADKKAADIAKADPARIWVQVAGGANEDTLPKEWARVRDRAPAAFSGKSGWTTPLRATNRVLTGPFKTGEEARNFVNLIAKSGISGFTFTSEAGQKVAKLPSK